MEKLGQSFEMAWSEDLAIIKDFWSLSACCPSGSDFGRVQIASHLGNSWADDAWTFSLFLVAG